MDKMWSGDALSRVMSQTYDSCARKQTFPFTIVKTKLNENVPLQNEDHDIKTGEEAKNGRDNDDDVLLLRSPFAKDRKKSPKQNQSKSLSKQIITSR